MKRPKYPTRGQIALAKILADKSLRRTAREAAQALVAESARQRHLTASEWLSDVLPAQHS